jgi:LysM repeat protein
MYLKEGCYALHCTTRGYPLYDCPKIQYHCRGPVGSKQAFQFLLNLSRAVIGIAQRFNVPLSELIRVNQIPPPYTIFPGQRIFVPGVEAPKPPPGGQVYIVQPGDTLFSIAEKFNVPLDSIIRLNNIPRPDLIYPGQRLILPALPASSQEEP